MEDGIGSIPEANKGGLVDAARILLRENPLLSKSAQEEALAASEGRRDAASLVMGGN